MEEKSIKKGQIVPLYELQENILIMKEGLYKIKAFLDINLIEFVLNKVEADKYESKEIMVKMSCLLQHHKSDLRNWIDIGVLDMNLCPQLVNEEFLLRDKFIIQKNLTCTSLEGVYFTMKKNDCLSMFSEDWRSSLQDIYEKKILQHSKMIYSYVKMLCKEHKFKTMGNLLKFRFKGENDAKAGMLKMEG